MFRAIRQPLLDAPSILTDSQASTKTVGIALRKKVHAADILPKTKRSKQTDKIQFFLAAVWRYLLMYSGFINLIFLKTLQNYTFLLNLPRKKPGLSQAQAPKTM